MRCLRLPWLRTAKGPVAELPHGSSKGTRPLAPQIASLLPRRVRHHAPEGVSGRSATFDIWNLGSLAFSATFWVDTSSATPCIRTLGSASLAASAAACRI